MSPKRRPSPQDKRARSRSVATPLVAMVVLSLCALGVVTYLLWPRWPEVPLAPDAPSLPISIAGTAFNIPPAAIRVAVQRRAGVQERVDLAFLWPSLNPPLPPAKAVDPAVRTAERLFVTIIASAGSLSPAERMHSIYPTYVEGEAEIGPDGLTLVPFGADTPYKGEDLLYDSEAPHRFAMRCTRAQVRPLTDMCLHDRRIGEADVTFRFPRAWLADWRGVSEGFDKLIARLTAPAR